MAAVYHPRMAIGSDDPKLFRTDLCAEFLRCAVAFDWSIDTVRRLLQNGVIASCLAPEAKDAFLAEQDRVAREVLARS